MSVPPCPASIGIDVGGENIERRHRRRLAFLGRVIDLLLHVGVDAGDDVIGDAELLEPLTIDFDRIALRPFFQFARGAIFGRVSARMAAVAIGHALDQRWAVAGTRFFVCSIGGAKNFVGVVAVDDEARSAAGCCTAVTSPIGVYSMYRLFSQTKITGSFHTAAKFSASWNAPILVVPSPKKHTETSFAPLYWARQAAPQAIGRCAPMMA